LWLAKIPGRKGLFFRLKKGGKQSLFLFRGDLRFENQAVFLLQ
jgi:hypothetical protein